MLARTYYHFLHCAIQCCINHPFIIFMKTRRLRGRVPLTFLQQSYQTAGMYADWIYRLICEMDEASLMLEEPFAGYLVSIGASIHLERSLSASEDTAKSMTAKFDKCLGYVRRLASTWPNMTNLLDLLELLKLRLGRGPSIRYVQTDYDGAQPTGGARSVTISDTYMHLMWTLFDYVSISEETYKERMNRALRRSEPGHGSQQERPQATDGTNVDAGFSSAAPQNEQLGSTNSTLDVEVPNLQEDLGVGLTDDWSLFGASWSSYWPSQGPADVW
ncbi:hypothetical protein F5883DRAFT_31914 [Diaporthe sp. PMI_573]|nr:hypothetical protein F5883DRAFT_31914 [Diaporthaceae sp. PMI_573]